jgi:hypothetical protein
MPSTAGRALVFSDTPPGPDQVLFGSPSSNETAQPPPGSLTPYAISASCGDIPVSIAPMDSSLVPTVVMSSYQPRPLWHVQQR